MKRSRDYKEVEKEIYRFLKCKKVAALRDFLYKF